MPERPFDPVRRTVTVDGARVAYTDDGPAASRLPPLLAVHGAPGSTYDWRWLGASLQQRLRLIRLDLPGHGESERGSRGGVTMAPTAAAMAAAVWRVADALPGLDEGGGPVALLGHSLGADVVWHMAAQQRDRVAGVAVVNPVGLRPHRALRPWGVVQAVARGLDTPLRPLLRPLLRQAFVRGLGFPDRVSTDEIEWSHRRAAGRDFDELRGVVGAVRAAGTPTLVAFAGDDHLVEEDVSLELVDALAGEAAAGATRHGPRIYRFAHGGHYLQKMHAALLADEVVGWLADGGKAGQVAV